MASHKANNYSAGCWDMKRIDPDLNQRLLQDFRGERTGYLQVGKRKYFLPRKFEELSFGYKNFKARCDDTWVVSFPRSGTTWTQEMLWLLANDLDYEKANKIPLTERFPFLEFYSCVSSHVEEECLGKLQNDERKRRDLANLCESAIIKLENTLEPRFIKTHLPFSLLPDDLLASGAKVVYVARNPKDVAVSFYHHHRRIRTLDFVGDFPKFWKYFQENHIIWSPYWEHLREGWERRQHPNVFFVFYEEMRKDLIKVVKRLSTFLQKDYSDEDIEVLMRHLDISNFQKNASVNMERLKDLGMINDHSQQHVRNGKCGSWRELFSRELNERADVWIQENIDRTGIELPICL